MKTVCKKTHELSFFYLMEDNIYNYKYHEGDSPYYTVYNYINRIINFLPKDFNEYFKGVMEFRNDKIDKILE